MRTLLLIAGLLVFIGWQAWGLRVVPQPPGMVAPRTPRQVPLPDAKPFLFEGYRIKPLAFYEIEARVLSRHRYRWGRQADLSPIDLALGWGPMSDNRVLDHIDIDQSNRFAHYRFRRLPIPAGHVNVHSANVHVVPAGDEVERELGRIRRGHVVRLGGYLVDIKDENGWHWRSSLSRTDTGDGACELLFVDRISVL